MRWLATYHAYFWEQPTPGRLQPQGSYWWVGRWAPYEHIYAFGRTQARDVGLAAAGLVLVGRGFTFCGAR